MKDLIDTHCHILYGVDDGAKTLNESWKMLLLEQKGDVRTVICTPHHRTGMFETSMDLVKTHFCELQRLVKEKQLPICLYLGCEYHWESKMIENLDAGKYPTIAGGKYVLVEFSVKHTYNTVRSAIYRLTAAGYNPIIAHIERYPQVVNQLSHISDLIELGAWVQITASSVLGKDGWEMKRICAKLLKQNLVHLIATDAHDCKKRIPGLKICYKFIEKKYGEPYAEELFCTKARKILNHETE